MLLRRGFTFVKIILSSYYYHAFEKGAQFFLNGVHFYKNNIIFMLLEELERGFTFMKNTK